MVKVGVKLNCEEMMDWDFFLYIVDREVIFEIREGSYGLIYVCKVDFFLIFKRFRKFSFVFL